MPEEMSEEQEPRFGNLSKSQVEAIGAYYQGLSELECDGLSRILISSLALHKVSYKTFCGDLFYQGQVAAPMHLWIEILSDDKTLYRLDYRARMWCLGLAPNESLRGVKGLDTVPHGLIAVEELRNFPAVEYGRQWSEEIEIKPLPIAVARFLVTPLEFPPSV